MSTNDFDRAIPSGAEPPAYQGVDSLLPGFEPPPAARSGAGAGVSAEPGEIPAVRDPLPQEDATPPLPGLAKPPEHSAQAEPPSAGKASTLTLRPPAKNRSGVTGPSSTPPPVGGLNTAAALAALAGVLGVGLVIACICLFNVSQSPTAQVANDIPLALLPDSADPALWETVSRMAGEINGNILVFERGLATDSNGQVYRVQFDFCRSGSDIYAKVLGDKTYVVRLDAHGRITKSYPAPKNSKPLKELFGR